MEVSSSSPTSSQSQRNDPEMEASAALAQAAIPGGDSNVWDWGDLLDFTVDGDLAIDWSAPAEAAASAAPEGAEEEAPEMAEEEAPEEAADPGRVRKRDPRMSCSNFLAGRVPCACPELDAQMMAMEMEEEESGREKKRTRHGGARAGGAARAAGGVARCQVPSCGADIKELKGYHRRHRVCLRCANAATVVIAGEEKRYCQQCGKFHELSDFDEGKRSCRRKLERHNNRRRRKPVDSKGAIEKESQGDIQSEDASGDGETGKDSSQIDSQMGHKETCLEYKAPDVNSDGVVSLDDSGETQMEGGKYNGKNVVSVSYSNKSTYSSLCPTGRISFKLYDWNPAEFPRRLRHQIFEWLSNMPVELEGYIRPGCIILTVFVAMPRFMWTKISEDPVSYVHDFVVAPGGMLSGRGNTLVYLNNMVFHVLKGGTSVIKAKMNVQAPRLHYVHPMCFEAGKPMEIFACGSNLLQPKLRFLLSFAGTYLAHDYGPESSHLQTGPSLGSNGDHQLYRIHVPQTEENHFGPVFIEVENESGLSNFIPVIIGDKETCSEMKVIQQRLDNSMFPDEPSFSSSVSRSNSCEVSSLRQIAFSEIIVDIAWLLQKPVSENIQQKLTTFQVQRLRSLLNFLISVESTTILDKILENLKTSIDKIKLKGERNAISDTDLRLLEKYVEYAHQRRPQKLLTKTYIVKEDIVSRCGFQSEKCSVSFPVQDTEITVDDKCGVLAYNKRSETIPILTRERVLSEACWHSSSELQIRPQYRSVLRFRPTICLIGVAAVCLGVCSVIFHPHKVTEFAISIRRCLLNKM